MDLLACITLGAATGATLGLTGAGGGVLAIPLMTFFLGLTHTEAAPIALVAIAVSAYLAALIGLKEGILRYRAAILIGGCGMSVAPLGVLAAAHASSEILATGLACVMLLSAAATWRSGLATPSAPKAPSITTWSTPCTLNPSTGRLAWTTKCFVVLASIGIATGALSGLLGVGGGFFLVPALARLTNLRLESIVCTSQAVIALVSTAGALTAVTTGELNWTIALPFTTAAMGGIAIGRLWSRQLPARRVKRAFALLCFGIAAALLSKVMYLGMRHSVDLSIFS